MGQWDITLISLLSPAAAVGFLQIRLIWQAGFLGWSLLVVGQGFLIVDDTAVSRWSS